MGVWRRRVVTVTVAVAGLLLAGGCTAAPRVPPAEPVAPLAGAAPVRMPLPAAPQGWSADRVLGVVWRGAPGAESAELGWLDALSLRPRPGRRLSLGRYGAPWAVAPDGSLVFGPGDRAPLHLFGSRQVTSVQVSRGRAYVDLTPSSDWWVAGDSAAADREVAVVDLAAGQVVAQWRGRMPELLVDACCEGPVG